MADQTNNSSFDSGLQSIAAVYAKALLGAAEKAQAAEGVLAELDSFVTEAVEKQPKFDAVLCSPRVAFEEKERLLDLAVGKSAGAKASPQFLNFLKVVCRHERFNCMRAIRRAAHKQYNEMRGRIEVRLQTAAPVSGELLSDVVTRLHAALGGEIELTTEFDPELLGGMVVRVGDTVYDGSLAGQLQRMRGEALAKTTQHLRDAVSRFAQ